MTEAGRPGASTPLAADDMIGSLATRVRELSLRVAQLEGELEAARRRIAVYEDFDAQVQDSLSAALRAANQIRERARVTGEAIAEEARAQRPAAVAELDAMRIERDALRRAIEDASSSTASARSTAPVASIPMSEMRTAATEALRGVFKELVAEIRATTPASTAVVQTAVQTPAAASARPDNSPAPSAQPPIYQVPPAQRPASPTPPPASNITASAPVPAPVQPPQIPAPPQQSWSAPAPAPREPYAAPLSSYNVPSASPFSAPQGQPLPRPTIVPAQAESSAVVEDIDVAPAAAAPAAAAPAPAAPPPPAAQPTPAPAAPAPPPEWQAQPGDPIGEVQVVLSPISSFPRLVELERRLQGMAVVRTVYARDFRNGVATLAIGLRHPMTVDEFATAVTKLEYPRLRIVSTSGYVLELRIDSEASSIA